MAYKHRKEQKFLVTKYPNGGRLAEGPVGTRPMVVWLSNESLSIAFTVQIVEHRAVCVLSHSRSLPFSHQLLHIHCHCDGCASLPRRPSPRARGPLQTLAIRPAGLQEKQPTTFVVDFGSISRFGFVLAGCCDRKKSRNSL